MQNMPNMMAYTIRGGGAASNCTPFIVIGNLDGGANFYPQNPQDDSYWIAIIDANNPTKLVKDFLIPGSNNSTVPTGLDTYMSNPQYLFAVTTQNLATPHVPQGDWYDYLVKYGAGRELQRLEQINWSLGCGMFGWVGYVLTGSCGPRDDSSIPPPTYEMATITQASVVLTMSLMPMPHGKPPYSVCDSFTFNTGAKKKG